MSQLCHRFADLDQKRPIWLGGQGRAEKDMALFFNEIGPERCASIELAVMDMWKPFSQGYNQSCPSDTDRLDKFHILNHLANALDQVRRSELLHERVNDKERRFIKGQRYTLLSSKANLNIEGQRALGVAVKSQ